MKCPNCSGAELVRETRDLPYTYNGETTLIPAVQGDFCPACGEAVLCWEQGDRYGELIHSFQRQVSADKEQPFASNALR